MKKIILFVIIVIVLLISFTLYTRHKETKIKVGLFEMVHQKIAVLFLSHQSSTFSPLAFLSANLFFHT